MFDFFEKAYYAELERKTKLHTALAFPFTGFVVGFGLLNTVNMATLRSFVPALLFSVCIVSFVVYLWSSGRFLLGGTYEYVAKPEEYIEHRETLLKFSEEYPDAPAADQTFQAQLEQDLARCASKNAAVNDARSQNLYYANAATLVFVVAALLLACMEKLRLLWS